MILADVACVLANTTRSQAYIQALVRKELIPSVCLILSEDSSCHPLLESIENPYFNTSESILETLEKHQIKYQMTTNQNINSDEVMCMIQTLPQRYIIYSGYGGYILKPHLFQMGKKWIHIHAGLLPQYRGSTTMYYSFLHEHKLGATAIFLNEKIDDGNVITAKASLPEKGELIDYIYDPFIRSCVLIQALNAYIENGKFPELPQQIQNAETYYVIHPVLKHIAILDMNQRNKLGSQLVDIAEAGALEPKDTRR